MSFKRSSYCRFEDPLCVLVDVDRPGVVAVADSADLVVELICGHTQWSAFLTGVKADVFGGSP